MCTNENFDMLVMLHYHDPEDLENILLKIREMETAMKKKRPEFYIKECEVLKVLLVESNLDSEYLALKLRENHGETVSYAVHIDDVVRTRIECILQKVVELADDKIGKGNSFRVISNLMSTNIKSSEELNAAVSKEIKNKLNLRCDEENPDWVVQLEVVGENTGIIIFNPKNLLKNI
ncbi:THUMP domain-containing protein [Methanobacterium aggregans]|uniref:THUMP domain-containing protein n=1 Tax=Methanobacterium aggregans TaxID=1615586 RepID=UPI001AE8DB27|nr:THUMP domain-containing protein [Methanobacterium aggregans]MBP2046895.1 tRNA acetyltransferase TAN1 [Methanobacterium aggregans]